MKTLQKTLQKTLIATAIAGFVTPFVAHAELEEIIVTAQKREQSLQDVSIAISAFDSTQLAELGLTSLEQLPLIIPNVELSDARGAGQPTWVIRGAGLEDFNTNNTPVSAIFYDEVYMTSNALGGIGLFDVDRVEVLKGPQGGLYGRNATGGAIRILSAKPDLNFSNMYSLTHHSLTFEIWSHTPFEICIRYSVCRIWG